jgi:energy-coupling factor transporter ATP-binding protein EcfA2
LATLAVSTGLDPRVCRTMIYLLCKLPTTTHDMKLAQDLFPRIIVMDEDQVVVDGLKMEILEKKNICHAC